MKAHSFISNSDRADNNNDYKSEKHDRTLQVLMLIFCVAIAFVINFMINQKSISLTQREKFSIEDFSLSGLEQYEENNQLITTNEDSHAVLEFGFNTYVSKVELNLSNRSEGDWTIQAFYAANNEHFSEENSVSQVVTYSDDKIILDINSKVSRLRIDFGDASNRVIEVSSIIIDQETRILFGSSYIVIIFITFFLYAVLYRIKWIIKNFFGVSSNGIAVFDYLKKKDIWEKVICFLVISCLMGVSIIRFSYLLSKPDSYSVRPGFYDAENCDVLLLGTSHMYDGIYPMELYRDYGISSYNLAIAGERLSMSYYSLMDAIQIHQPKVVVIDMHGLEYGNYKNDPDVPDRCHITFDSMRWTNVKIQAIMDCVNKESWPEFFFPLYFYHNRWSELTQKDFQKRQSKRELSRGGAYAMGVANASPPTLIDITDHEFIEDYSTEYLQRIISLCSEKDIKVLLIYIPFPAPENAQKRANMAYELAQCNDNAEYINFLYNAEEIGINYQIDTADSHSHLNPSGARKFTRHIGEYLTDNYELTDYSGDQKWETAYQKYMSEVKDLYFTETSDLYQYLMLMSDPDYSCYIYYTNSDIGYEDDLLRALIENINTETDLVMKCMDTLEKDNAVFPTEYGDVAVTMKVVRNDIDKTIDVSYWDINGNRIVSNR